MSLNEATNSSNEVDKISSSYSEDDVIAKTSKSGSLIRQNCNTNACEQSSFAPYPDQIATSRTECGYGGKKKKKKKNAKKASVTPHQKGRFLFDSGGREGSAVVSSHWRGQRGEFPMLHHSDGCVQLHYV